MTRLQIRKGTAADVPFLWEMLYLSIYTPEGEVAPPRDILQQPAIEKYLRDWGRAGDLALIVVDVDDADGASGASGADGQERPVGAIWMRLLGSDEKGYGFVDEATPEVGMAILAEYRGLGIGRKLLAQLSAEAESLNYAAISLSVDPRNLPALRLYEASGFVKVYEDEGGSWTMKKELSFAL